MGDGLSLGVLKYLLCKRYPWVSCPPGVSHVSSIDICNLRPLGLALSRRLGGNGWAVDAQRLGTRR